MKFDPNRLPENICTPYHPNKDRTKKSREAVLLLLDKGDIVTHKEIQQAYFYLYNKKCSYGNAHQVIAEGMRRKMLKRIELGIYLKVSGE